MADYITGINTPQGKKKIDYNSLANLPSIGDTIDLTTNDKESIVNAINEINAEHSTTAVVSGIDELYLLNISSISHTITITVNGLSLGEYELWFRYMIYSEEDGDWISDDRSIMINGDGEYSLITENNIKNASIVLNNFTEGSNPDDPIGATLIAEYKPDTIATNVDILKAQMGDIETALDSIIAMQNELMGVSE